MKRVVVVLLFLLSVAPSIASGQAVKPAANADAGRLSADTRQKLIASLDRGAAFLLSQQKPDGTFEGNPGVTGIAATALLRQPAAGRQKTQAAAFKTLDYLRTLAKPDGGIYDSAIPHNITAVSAMAFVAGSRTRRLSHGPVNIWPSTCSTKAKGSRPTTSSTAAWDTAGRATAAVRI